MPYLPQSRFALAISVTMCLAFGFGGKTAAQQRGSEGNGPALRFDVASVRENRSNGDGVVGDKPYTNFPIGSDDAFHPTGGIFSAINLPLVSYIIFAYKPMNNRAALMASLPDWVKTESYNIEARTDDHAVTKDQMREMMRTLLEERFGLRAHHETKVVSVYAAELVKAEVLGPMLRRHPQDEPCLASDETPEKPIDPAGFPVKCGFANALHTDLQMHRKMGGANLPIAMIVASLGAVGNLGKPVIDRTGLFGGYDYTFDYLPEPEPGANVPQDAVGPTLVEAMRTELGLKLVAAKAPIDFVIVDHVERPTAN